MRFLLPKKYLTLFPGISEKDTGGSCLMNQFHGCNHAAGFSLYGLFILFPSSHKALVRLSISPGSALDTVIRTK
ncbi:hypothetical protein WN944_016030 [Citrus x changshan-huyou]|uniref:Uncharacterized protein n=1 Tax=Citrus x changshan-huyou TaxID=2935761 RepID=A0AAP0MCX6_9ROSI